MQTDKLYELAEKNGIMVEGHPLPQTQAVTIKLGENYFVAIDTAVLCSPAGERVCLAHELGHCQTASVYSQNDDIKTRGKNERKAEIWAIKKLVPFKELKDVIIKTGTDDLAVLSEHFSVTPEFMYKALLYYQEQKENNIKTPK